MVVMGEVAAIKTFFALHQVHLSDVWLESCIGWCKEENLPPNYTLKDLQLKVYEQWLLLDLRDIEVPCLPLNLSAQKQYTLTGNYTLQMMQVVDISRPKHWQLQKIRNTVSKNAEVETQAEKRMLQLTLTDGVQEVEAMEFKPVPSLSLNLTPGIKIRLMGPVDVKRGRLMLKSKNVKILGGEVDDLIIPNAAENVLAKFLKLPLNLNPQVIEESLLTANKDMFDETGEASVMNTVLSNVTQPAVSNRIDRQATANVSHVPRNGMDLNEEQEMRIAAEIDLLMEMEREFDGLPPNKPRSVSKTPDMFDDMNDSEFENIDIPPTAVRTIKECSATPVNEVADKLLSSLELENDVFAHLDLDQIEKQNKTPPKAGILTIEKLLKNIPNISNGKFKIKAKFKSIVEKLTVADDEFHLVIKVEDGSGDFEVKIHSDVVADMAGFYPSALMSLKTSVAENNAEAQEKVLEALRKIKERLLQLNDVVEVQVSSNEKFPVVVNIL